MKVSSNHFETYSVCFVILIFKTLVGNLQVFVFISTLVSIKTNIKTTENLCKKIEKKKSKNIEFYLLSFYYVVLNVSKNLIIIQIKQNSIEQRRFCKISKICKILRRSALPCIIFVQNRKHSHLLNLFHINFINNLLN